LIAAGERFPPRRGRKAEARYDRKWQSDAESELLVVMFESVVINVVPPALFASES
jgi:hypothetical protein